MNAFFGHPYFLEQYFFFILVSMHFLYSRSFPENKDCSAERFGTED